MRKFNENQPEQRTADWHRARLGHFTGSQIVKLMGTGRKKDDVFSATAISYIFQVASERLLSEKVVEDDEMFWLYLEQVSHTNRAMQWGIDNENEATSYPVAPNNTVTLWDKNLPTIYIKSVNAQGVPSMRILDFTERASAAHKTPSTATFDSPNNFVTIDSFNALEAKFSALESKVDELRPREREKAKKVEVENDG